MQHQHFNWGYFKNNLTLHQTGLGDKNVNNPIKQFFGIIISQH